MLWLLIGSLIGVVISFTFVFMKVRGLVRTHIDLLTEAQLQFDADVVRIEKEITLLSQDYEYREKICLEALKEKLLIDIISQWLMHDDLRIEVEDSKMWRAYLLLRNVSGELRSIVEEVEGWINMDTHHLEGSKDQIKGLEIALDVLMVDPAKFQINNPELPEHIFDYYQGLLIRLTAEQRKLK